MAFVFDEKYIFNNITEQVVTPVHFDLRLSPLDVQLIVTGLSGFETIQILISYDGGTNFINKIYGGNNQIINNINSITVLERGLYYGFTKDLTVNPVICKGDYLKLG